MKLYHGSDLIIDTPKVFNVGRPLDFGGGFYLTSSKEQAERWARRVSLRNNSDIGYVSSYEFDFDKAKEDLKVLKFDSATKEWLEFVCANRGKRYHGEQYDIIIGPVADDKVYSVVVKFENGEYELEEALKRLKVERLCDQVLFHSEKSIKYLKFISWEEIK